MLFRPLLASGCALFIGAQLAFADSSSEVVNENQCNQSFIAGQDRVVHRFDYPENIASDSVPSTIAAAVGALTAVQVMRFLGADADPNLSSFERMFTPGFVLTVPTDVVLTVGTHMIAIGPIPFLKTLLAGKTFGPRYEAVTRTVANATLGTGAILTAWATSGIDISSTHVAAAAGLCAAVYPVLMTTKKLLFHWLPSWRDGRRMARLREIDTPGSQQLEKQALDEARRLGVTERQAKAMLLGYFEAIVTGQDYEHKLAANSELMADPNIARIVEQLLNHHETKSSRKLMKLRRALVDLLIDRLSFETDAALRSQLFALLRIAPEHSDHFTLAMHQELSKRAAAYWRELVTASVADQAISVGIAGGIFLYGVNQWAATGAVPWFVVW